METAGEQTAVSGLTKSSKLSFTPTQATILVAIIGAISASGGAAITAFATRGTEESKSQALIAIEKFKVDGELKLEASKEQAAASLARAEFETRLIFRAIEGSSSEEERTRNLKFFLRAGFISDPEGKIAALKPAEYPSKSDPGFDCRQATTLAELALCGDDELSEKSRKMGAAYQSLVQKLDEKGRVQLRREQRDWIRNRDQQCVGDDASACVSRMLDSRMRQLTDALEKPF
jgi:uncharacterized protein YecT (DUF1311 family)